jgi:hypothetical protein
LVKRARKRSGEPPARNDWLKTVRLSIGSCTFSFERRNVDFVEPRILWHALRAPVLGAVRARPSRATDLTRRLGPPLQKVVYHLSVLERTQYIQRVEGQDPDCADPIYEAGPR